MRNKSKLSKEMNNYKSDAEKRRGIKIELRYVTKTVQQGSNKMEQHQIE